MTVTFIDVHGAKWEHLKFFHIRGHHRRLQRDLIRNFTKKVIHIPRVQFFGQFVNILQNKAHVVIWTFDTPSPCLTLKLISQKC